MRLLRQSIRFVLVGTAGTGAYALLFLLGRRLLSAPVALGLAWLVSTLATNATHRAVTFGVRRTEGWRADALFLLGTSLLGLGVTQLLISGAAPGLQVLFIVAGTAAAGALRFVLIRWWLARSAPSQATHSRGTLGPLARAPESGA